MDDTKERAEHIEPVGDICESVSLSAAWLQFSVLLPYVSLVRF